MRGEHDLYQPKDGAECEHLEFKCHGYPDADCDRTRYHRLEPTAQSADSSEGAAGHLHPHHVVVGGLGAGLQPGGELGTQSMRLWRLTWSLRGAAGVGANLLPLLIQLCDIVHPARS